MCRVKITGICSRNGVSLACPQNSIERWRHVAFALLEHDQLDGEAVKCIIEKSPRRQSAKFRFLEAG